MKQINKDHIISVLQVNKKQDKSVKYVPARKKSFLKAERKEGYKISYDFHERIYSAKEIIGMLDNTLYEENNSFYVYPNLYITMSNKETITKYFKTLEELEGWRNENLNGINLIEV